MWDGQSADVILWFLFPPVVRQYSETVSHRRQLSAHNRLCKLYNFTKLHSILALKFQTVLYRTSKIIRNTESMKVTELRSIDGIGNGELRYTYNSASLKRSVLNSRVRLGWRATEARKRLAVEMEDHALECLWGLAPAAWCVTQPSAAAFLLSACPKLMTRCVNWEGKERQTK